jgi:putative zinc finger/helix-turn-helix YgiT family protein
MQPEVMDYITEIVHDGRPYTVTVPALRTPRCQNPACRTIILDTDANRRISQTFRRTANLLEPEEIRRRREELGLKQTELAARLDVAPATLSRWETGAQIQQRSLDKLLRLFFGLPEVRRALDPPTQGAFRLLRPTPEMHRRAKHFRLTASRGTGLGKGPTEHDGEGAEVEAGDPAAT